MRGKAACPEAVFSNSVSWYLGCRVLQFFLPVLQALPSWILPKSWEIGVKSKEVVPPRKRLMGLHNHSKFQIQISGLGAIWNREIAGWKRLPSYSLLPKCLKKIGVSYGCLQVMCIWPPAKLKNHKESEHYSLELLAWRYFYDCCKRTCKPCKELARCVSSAASGEVSMSCLMIIMPHRLCAPYITTNYSSQLWHQKKQLVQSISAYCRGFSSLECSLFTGAGFSQLQ